MTQELLHAVAEGLGAANKWLPSWIFYDAAGSELYEEITALPEYYPWRAELAIFERHADALMLAALGPAPAHATVVELGAGSAAKTVVLLRALARSTPHITFIPVDLSATALTAAAGRLAVELPAVEVRPLVATHQQTFTALATVPAPKATLFIGSSIGNYDDDQAAALLRGLRDGGALVLGTDLVKSPEILVPAYDDARGVTAAFNRNALARINRELGGHFQPERFRHVALWNAALSRIEMHLEATSAQTVAVDALGRSFRFGAGERIHTESSVKYDLAHIDRLLAAAGFSRAQTFFDERRWFAVNVARITSAAAVAPPASASRPPR